MLKRFVVFVSVCSIVFSCARFRRLLPLSSRRIQGDRSIVRYNDDEKEFNYGGVDDDGGGAVSGCSCDNNSDDVH